MGKFDFLTDDVIDLRLSLHISKHNLQYYYRILKANTKEVVGYCGIRLGNTESFNYLGNIEYEIIEKYRGNNYSVKAGILLTEIAKFHGFDNIVVTADPKNIASIKVIEKLGCTHVNVVEVPKNSVLYRSGHKAVSVYKMNLKESGIRK